MISNKTIKVMPAGGKQNVSIIVGIIVIAVMIAFPSLLIFTPFT
jgi:hypothetical protein